MAVLVLSVRKSNMSEIENCRMPFVRPATSASPSGFSDGYTRLYHSNASGSIQHEPLKVGLLSGGFCHIPGPYAKSRLSVCVGLADTADPTQIGRSS